jgi:hypothetical protein
MLLSALGFVLPVAPATAVTIGQLAPAPSDDCGGGPFDLVQRPVEAGASYVVPSTGGITSWKVTSWATNASADPAQTQALKMFRKVAEPRTYTVVSREGPHPLAPGLNRFAADLEVHAGEILGSNWNAPPEGRGACQFPGPGSFDFKSGDLAVGATEPFEADSGFLVNISAEISPTSDFTVSPFTVRKNGTAVTTLNLPNPGDLVITGRGVTGAVSAVSAVQVSAGQAQVVIRAKGKKKRKLAEKGKVKVTPTIAFTPTGGTASTQTTQVKLRRK